MVLKFHLPSGQEFKVTIDDEPQIDSPYERIWQGFLRLRLQDLVVRSGFMFCGVYPEAENVTTPVAEVASLDDDGHLTYTGHGIKHPETTSMHAFSCINLMQLLADEFPELFVPGNQTAGVGPHNRSLIRARNRLARLFAYHDSSEGFCGDTPDDGSCPPDDKNAIERYFLRKNIQHLKSATVRQDLAYDFVAFQYPTAVGLYAYQNDYDRQLIQLAKLIDKVDAVLAALKHELEGHPGYLSEKERNYGSVTAQDRKFIELCGTSAIADCWAAHFIADYHEFYGFNTIMRLLHTAVVQTRGEWYPWWEKFCEVYPTVKFTPPL